MMGSKILATGIKQSGLLKEGRSSEYLEKEEEKAPRVQRTVQMTDKAWVREQQQQQQWG
jgi:hypothetical protein